MCVAERVFIPRYWFSSGRTTLKEKHWKGRSIWTLFQKSILSVIQLSQWLMRLHVSSSSLQWCQTFQSLCLPECLTCVCFDFSSLQHGRAGRLWPLWCLWIYQDQCCQVGIHSALRVFANSCACILLTLSANISRLFYSESLLLVYFSLNISAVRVPPLKHILFCWALYIFIILLLFIKFECRFLLCVLFAFLHRLREHHRLQGFSCTKK